MMKLRCTGSLTCWDPFRAVFPASPIIGCFTTDMVVRKRSILVQRTLVGRGPHLVVVREGPVLPGPCPSNSFHACRTETRLSGNASRRGVQPEPASRAQGWGWCSPRAEIPSSINARGRGSDLSETAYNGSDGFGIEAAVVVGLHVGGQYSGRRVTSEVDRG